MPKDYPPVPRVYHSRSTHLASLRPLLVFGLVAAAAWLQWEWRIRLMLPLMREPTRSVYREMQRMVISNLRTYRGVSKVFLPPPFPAEIAVVGNSFPFGQFVEREDSFPMQLQSRMSRPVVNLGVPGQPSDFARMIEISMRYGPRQIVYCLSAVDFADVLPPRALVSGADAIENTDPYLDRVGWRDEVGRDEQFLWGHLLTRRTVRKLFGAEPVAAGTPPLIDWRDAHRYFLFLSKQYWDSRLSWNRPAVKEAVASNLATILSAERYLASRQVGLLVVLLPSKEMTYAAVIEHPERVYEESHRETYRQLAARLRESSIPVLDLTDDFRQAARAGESLYFAIDPHFREDAHRLTADRIAQALTGTSPRGLSTAVPQTSPK